MNKQNLTKNLSLLNYKKGNIPSKQGSAQMSFRNINAKSFFKNEHRQQHSRSPAATKRNKTNTNRVESSVIHTEVSDSIASNQNNNLMEAFKIQRQSLVNSLKLYKDQIQMMSQQNSKLKKQTLKYKNQNREKQQGLKEVMDKNIQLTKKVGEYQNMLPKLIQLQQLQQKIISENNVLKNKIKVQQALLTNVANIAKCEQNKSPSLQKIYTLTQVYLNSAGNHPSKKSKKSDFN